MHTKESLSSPISSKRSFGTMTSVALLSLFLSLPHGSFSQTTTKGVKNSVSIPQELLHTSGNKNTLFVNNLRAFVADIDNSYCDKINICSDMQKLINSYSQAEIQKYLSSGSEADALRGKIVQKALEEIEMTYTISLPYLREAVDKDDLYALQGSEFHRLDPDWNWSAIYAVPAEVYDFYKGKYLAFEQEKRVHCTQKLIENAFKGTGVSVEGKYLNLALSRFESFGQVTYYDNTRTKSPNLIVNLGKTVLEFSTTKEFIRTANLINYLRSVGKTNLHNVKNNQPYDVENNGKGLVDLNTGIFTEATIVTQEQMENIYPFLQGDKIMTIINALNYQFAYYK